MVHFSQQHLSPSVAIIAPSVVTLEKAQHNHTQHDHEICMEQELAWLFDVPDFDELLPLGGSFSDADDSTPSDAPSSAHSVGMSVEDKDVARRRRKRESMAYYRAQDHDRIESLKTQKEALARILQQVLIHNKPTQSNNTPTTPLQQYKARFTELVRLRESLLIEKRELTGLVAASTQRYEAVGRMLEIANELHASLAQARQDDEDLMEMTRFVRATYREFHPAKGEEPEEEDAADTLSHSLGESDELETGHWLKLFEDEPPLFYEYVAPEACAAVIFKGLSAIENVDRVLSEAKAYAIFCLGWTAQRVPYVDAVTGRLYIQIRCIKRIPRLRVTLDELQEMTWDFVSSPARAARAHHGNVKTMVAQTLNDDTVVMLRNTLDHTKCMHIRYFCLLTRRWSDDGHSALVMLPMLDKEANTREPLTNASSIHWIKQDAATFRFTHVSEDTTEVEFIGFMECMSNVQALHMMIANCSALLKWEAAVIPPNLLG